MPIMLLGEATTGTWQAVFDKVGETFSAANVTSVLTTAIGSAIALVFLYWGARKATSVLKRAFMRGKLKF